MSDFGDFDPEDAWDRGDDVPVLAHNLARRVAKLDGGTVPTGAVVFLLIIIYVRLVEHRTKDGNSPYADRLLEDLLYTAMRAGV